VRAVVPRQVRGDRGRELGVQARDGIVEQLDDVLGVVAVTAGVLLVDLVIVRRLEQAGVQWLYPSPGVEESVVVRVVKEVGVVGGTVDDREALSARRP